MTIIVDILQPGGEHMAGFIPHFLDEDNPAGTIAQLDVNYQHGGGWRPFVGFNFHPELETLTHPGDPTLHPYARIDFRKDRILIYAHGWVCVVLEDGSHQVCRMD